MAATRDYQRLFGALLESVPDPVTIIGSHGQTLFQNAASVAALPSPPPASIEDWERAFVLHSDDGARKLSISEWPLVRSLKGETVDRLEASVLRPNDQMRPVLMHVSAVPIYDEAGAIEGAILISRDVSALRRAEQELAVSQRLDAIGQLTGGVAHEFNNVLAAMTSLAETLQRSLADDPRADLARRIDEAAARGADLIRHLLVFDRRQALAPAAVNVNEVVTDLIGLLRPTLGDDVRIQANLAKDLPSALIDRAQLSTSLLNLALNSRTAMPNGGVLEFKTAIATYEHQNWIVVDVIDDGVGIPFEVQNKVFEPFYTTKAHSKASGLGLSIAYGFAKQSGGSIGLRSAPGEGATISLRLPIAAAADDGASTIAPTSAPRPHRPARILMVDDDEMVRHALSLSLEDSGYDVIVAKSGAEALAMLTPDVEIDLLLTDLSMPGMDGQQLATEVSRARPEMKIIIVTGHPPEQFASSGFTLLRKPLRTEALVAAIEKALG